MGQILVRAPLGGWLWGVGGERGQGVASLEVPGQHNVHSAGSSQAGALRQAQQLHA